MKAVVLDADWAPRAAARISERDRARRWAPNASEAYRNPVVTYRDVPDPGAPGPNDVILEVGACGLCGTDVHMLETDAEGYMLSPYHLMAPVITGHEFAGRVVAAGSDVTSLRVGEMSRRSPPLSDSAERHGVGI